MPALPNAIGNSVPLSAVSSLADGWPAVTCMASTSISPPRCDSTRLRGHRGKPASKRRAAKKATAIGKGATTGGKMSKSCGWPADAQSAAEAEEEILAAVMSLYADELKPFGRILRKRVAERVLEGHGVVDNIPHLDELPEVDSKQVRAACEACQLLHVDDEDGGDWSAVLVDRPPTFIDVYSPADCYNEQLWSRLQIYCSSTAGQAMSLPGGRYACARALKALQLPFLADFSLGRISHIVQLAIQQKKILGYMNGAVVPYSKSQSMMKDRCALYGQPITATSNGQSNSSLPIASRAVARRRVCEILDANNGEVPLSNVKRLFRSRFQLELSETFFGYSKLSDLLQDAMFADICRVELRGHGYVVIQVGQTQVPTSGETTSFERMCAMTDDMSVSASTALMGPPHKCLSPCTDSGDGLVACVQHTFLQYKELQTPLLEPKGRSRSLPKDLGASEPVRFSAIFCPEEPLEFEESGFVWGQTPDITPLPTPMPQTSSEPGCTESFAPPLPAQSLSLCGFAPEAPSHGVYRGCVIRLGEYV